jgi:hypothetical protein
MGVRKDPKDHAVRNSIGPTASEFGCMSWKGESGSQCHYGLDPVYLNVGLMKPRRGFTLAAGKEKLEVGKRTRAVIYPTSFCNRRLRSSPSR